MNKTMTRLGGATAILGGTYLLLLAGFQAFVNGDIEDYRIIEQTITLMPLLLTVGAIGLFARANGRRMIQLGAGIMALGSILMTIGFALMTWLDNETGWPLMMLGMMTLPIGMLIFGLVNWQAKVLSRWNKAPLFFGIITSFLILSAVVELWTEQQSELLFALYLLLLAASWILLGIPMVLDKSNFNNDSIKIAEYSVQSVKPNE